MKAARAPKITEARRTVNATAHGNNPYGHPVVGWMSDLQQMMTQDLQN